MKPNFITQERQQLLTNMDVSHNLLINPYPPHVAERGLLKNPHPHKPVHCPRGLFTTPEWKETIESLYLQFNMKVMDLVPFVNKTFGQDI